MARPEARGDGNSASVPLSNGEVTKLKMLTVNPNLPDTWGTMGVPSARRWAEMQANGQEVAAGPARAGPLADG